ncbi:hypothetical protein RBB77_11590 [Tunturibacter psychrotolerans]|uniref:Uncharacterized protein n=1 Tax=Tunturiibacter psychrotolerans TaxID=3069686 RepID=A0AAU7ZJY3_9BACT
MELETLKKFEPMLDQVVEYFCRMSGTKSYEEAIAVLREQVRDKSTSPAAWLHRVAREVYPTSEPDSVDPAQYYEILGMIDSREKYSTVFASLPEEAVPEIEIFFKFLLKEFLPAQRLAAQGLTKALPQRRTGGRKSKMPSEATCRKICAEIIELHAKSVLIGDAQRRAVKKWKIPLRSIQKIWAKRGELGLSS